MKRAAWAFAFVAAVGVAYLQRYEMVSAAAPNGATVFILDRWTGKVTACSLIECYSVYPRP